MVRQESREPLKSACNLHFDLCFLCPSLLFSDLEAPSMDQKANNLIFLILFIPLVFSHATVIESTGAGGEWDKQVTWSGQVIPVAGDTVIINGPVGVTAGAACQRLEIRAGGILSPFPNLAITLTVSGSIVNAGILKTFGDNDWGWGLILQISGNISNSSEWYTSNVTLTGSNDHEIQCVGNQRFRSSTFLNADTSAGITSTTNLTFTNTSFNLSGGDLILQETNTLTLDNCVLDSLFLKASRNRIHSADNTSFQNCVIENGVLSGLTKLGPEMTLLGETVNVDTMQCWPNSEINVNVRGHITNRGVIKYFGENDFGYPLNFVVSGNIANRGGWATGTLMFTGTETHHLIASNGSRFRSLAILNENPGTSLIADSSTVLSDTRINLSGAPFTLPAGSHLTLDNTVMDSTTLMANNNQVRLENESYLMRSTIENASFRGMAKIGEGVIFEKQVINGDTMACFPNTDILLQVNGDFINEGKLRTFGEDNWGHALTINLTGNLTNHGNWTAAVTHINGERQQKLEIPDTDLFATALNIVETNTGQSYQWSKDGIQLGGSTSATLALGNLDIDEYGKYQCRVKLNNNSELFGRNVIIDSVLTSTTGVDEEKIPATKPGSFRLEQNYPNPFNMSTQIPFEIATESQVRLTIYNTLGQQVKVLVDSRLPAGPHKVGWQGQDNSGHEVHSGVYIIRLQAGQKVNTRKISLMK